MTVADVLDSLVGVDPATEVRVDTGYGPEPQELASLARNRWAYHNDALVFWLARE